MYGRFTGELSAAEVERFFYLDDADRNLIARHSPPADRLRRRRGPRRWSHYWRKGRPILVAELTGNGLLDVVGDKGL